MHAIYYYVYEIESDGEELARTENDQFTNLKMTIGMGINIRVEDDFISKLVLHWNSRILCGNFEGIVVS